MVKMIGSFEDAVETGQSAVRNTGKTVSKSASSFANTTKGQLAGGQNQNPAADQGTNEQGNAGQQKMSDDDAQKFLQDLYGAKSNNTQSNTNPQAQQATKAAINVKTALGISSDPHQKIPTTAETIKTALGIPESNPEKTDPDHPQVSTAAALGVPQSDPNAGKTPEEIAKIEALRNQLHGDYYKTLINSVETQEEHVTEKIEREDQEKKLSDLEEQKKKPPPLPATVKQGTGENVVGVSG